MEAKLICYTLGKIDHKTRSKFKREFFGYIDKSNKGQYKYERHGLLMKIPHSKPIRSIVIVKSEDEEKVTKLLRKYKAIIKIYDVIINSEELKIPQGATPEITS